MAERGSPEQVLFPDSPVPGVVRRMLCLLGEEVGAGAIDRIWVFPPLIRGRKEWGLVAVSCLTEDPMRRELRTGRYAAELTGQGLVFAPELSTQGMAPPERLPRIMDGVVRRANLNVGVPREVSIGGDADRYAVLLDEYGSASDDDGEPAATRGETS